MKPYAVVFAGVPGSSKTIVSNYLSCEFGLPVFNNDQLRNEVKEDLLADNINTPHVLAEFKRRHSERLESFLAKRRPMILDFGMDRSWEYVKSELQKAGYDWFLIDMDLSRPFLVNLFTATKRAGFAQTKLDNYLKQHDEFVAKFHNDISVKITDGKFPNRNKVAAEALDNWLKKR